MTPHLMTTAEAADYLRVSHRSVEDAARRGEVGAKIAGRWKFSQADLDRYYEKAKVSYDPWRRSKASEAARRRRKPGAAA